MSKTNAQKVILQAIADKNKKIGYNEYLDYYNDYNDLVRYYDVDYVPAGRVIEKRAQNIYQRVRNRFIQKGK